MTDGHLNVSFFARAPPSDYIRKVTSEMLHLNTVSARKVILDVTVRSRFRPIPRSTMTVMNSPIYAPGVITLPTCVPGTACRSVVYLLYVKPINWIRSPVECAMRIRL